MSKPHKNPVRKQTPAASPATSPVAPSPSALLLRNILRWGIPLLACVLIVAARRPFLANPLVGEETYFAYLAVDNGRDPEPPQHKFLYQARVGGRMHYNWAEHPVPPYLLITKVLRPFSAGSKFSALSFNEKSRAARLPFFACFCGALVLLLVLAWDSLREADPLTVLLTGGLLLFGLTAPLMVGGSIQPQVDGSIGVLWVSLAALSLCLASRRLPLPALAGLAVLAGFAACLGKNEWAMAMFMAALAGLAGALVGRRFLKDADPLPLRHVQILCAGIVLGVVAGSFFSYFLDPGNYLGGLDVMRRTQKATFADWEKTFQSRLPWLWPEFVLLALALAAAALGRRELLLRLPGQVILLFWSLALMAGFIISSWPGDYFPRYFCTSIFGFLCFLVVFLPRLRLPAALRGAGLVLLLLGVGLNYAKLSEFDRGHLALGSSPGKPLAAHSTMIERTREQVLAAGSRPLVTDLNFGYYYPALNFIASAVPPDRVEALLKE